MFFNKLFLFALLTTSYHVDQLGVLGKDQKFHGCELGWFRYKGEKCVYIFDIPSTFTESQEYCKTAYGASLLNITSNDERMFWSFHLMRFSNLGSNVWLDKTDANLYESPFGITLKRGECLALHSKTASENGKVGDIIMQSCSEEAATVCEIKANKQIASKVEAKDFNINEDYVPNQRLAFSNGTYSELFSGVYYVMTSKFQNLPFSNGILGNGECSINGYHGQDCSNISIDVKLQDEFANYYIFTNESNNLVQIRRFFSDKILAYEPTKYLSNFKCFEDGLSKIGKEICAETLEDFGGESKWRIDPYKNTGYFVIRSNHRNLTLGAIEYKVNGKWSIGFGLYKSVDPNSELNDKMLFKIETLNYTLDVQLYSIEFDKSLQDVIAGNKKQISLVDTAIITNDSPASLTHEVSTTKELTETFSTSFGHSQEFMDSFVERDETGNSLTDTNSQSKSFTDSASEAISSTLSSSMSSSDTTSNESHSSSSSSGGGGGGISFAGFNLGGSYSKNSESGSSSSSSSTSSREQSQSETSNQEISKSKTASDELSKSSTADIRKSKETTKQNHTAIDKRSDEGGSRSKSYSVSKIVNLPPYSAVKISSYANWVDDMTISFRLYLKFTARSFRRKMNGEGTNAWRTMDSQFVKFLMKKEKFPGEVVKTGFDSVIGMVKGNMKASVGLESVFMAEETQLKKI